jgi:hypothetical protein
MTTAPQRLRRELEQQRERGRPFRVAWPIALSKALADLPLQQAIFWRSVFTEQASVWHPNYSGPNMVPSLLPDS